MPEFLAQHYFARNLMGTSISMNNPDSAYPAANGVNRDPSKPLKATGTSTTITLSGMPTSPEVFAIINHNLVGATVTLAASGGFSQAIPIPANSADGQRRGAWIDMREAAGRSGTWTLTVSGASANVAIGELVAGPLTPMPFLLGVELAKRHPRIQHKTFYGHKIEYDRGVRIRRASGDLISDVDRQFVLDLWDATKGPVLPWLFIPDIDVNDAWLVQFTDEELSWRRDSPEHGQMRVVIDEMGGGLPL